jgi:hypothetical protein
VSTRPVRHHVPLPDAAPDRLEAAADALGEMAVAVPGPAELVGLVDLAAHGMPAGPGEQPDAVTLTALDGPDPVAALLGLRAPTELWAVGFVSAARAFPTDHHAEPTEGAVVHLVARDGTALTLLAAPDHTRRLVGPSTEPQTGRVPDLCRRVLGLPTAPPPCGLGPHFVDLWLARVVHAALGRPSLTWAEAAALHPATDWVGLRTSAPSPADLVRATAEVDDPQLWETYRSVCQRGGRTPWDCLDEDGLAWLDAGSFARWMLGEAAPHPTVLEHLDAALPRATADKVFATVQLSPRAPWPATPTT